MYQIEVKRYLVTHLCHPKDGWNVHVDLDAMEMANGGVHPEGKRETALDCKQWMQSAGVTIGAHPVFGRTDVVASNGGEKTILIEVDGDASQQPEQAMYSALGQIILLMRQISERFTYALAVPDDPSWEKQLRKIPANVASVLGLKLYLVSRETVRELQSL